VIFNIFCLLLSSYSTTSWPGR